MGKATLITHQGWADHFSCNGLVNSYSNKYESLTLFALNESVATMLRLMYSDNSKINVTVPKLVTHEHINFGSETCIICHTGGSRFSCPRAGGNCLYVDYSEYGSYEHLKVGAFKNFDDWNRFISSSKKSFAHCFYGYENVPEHVRISDFRFAKVDQIKRPETDYVTLHDDAQRGFLISKPRFNFVQLNQLSKTMIDVVDILQHSKEIHLIDSNYSVMVHLMSFHDQMISRTPKFLHASSRGNRDIGIYSDPAPNLWTVI